MADDLRRFIGGREINARRLTLIQRQARWLRRHRRLTIGAIAASFLLIAAFGTVMSVYSRRLADRGQELQAALTDANHLRGEAEKQTLLAEQRLELAERSEQKATESELYARGMSYRSETQRAYEHFSRSDLVGAASSLATQIPTEDMNDLRGIQWRLLDAEVNAKRCMLGSHTGPATACVLYPHGDFVATAGEDGIVQLWDIGARKRLRSFNPKIGQIHAMAISPDGKTLAVAGAPSAGLFGFAAVHLLDSVTGAAKAVIQRHKTTIESIQFSPDGKLLAAGSRYEEVKLTTVAGNPLHSFTNTDRNVSIAFSADSRFLATPWEKKKLFRIWDCQSGDVV